MFSPRGYWQRFTFRGRETPPVVRVQDASYLISALPPASSIFFFSASASFFSIPSLTGFGIPSTRSFASFRPSPVTSRTTLITWIFLSAKSVRITLKSVFSSAAGPAAPGAGGGRRRDAKPLLESLDVLVELENREPLHHLQEFLFRHRCHVRFLPFYQALTCLDFRSWMDCSTQTSFLFGPER